MYPASEREVLYQAEPMPSLTTTPSLPQNQADGDGLKQLERKYPGWQTSGDYDL